MKGLQTPDISLTSEVLSFPGDQPVFLPVVERRCTKPYTKSVGTDTADLEGFQLNPDPVNLDEGSEQRVCALNIKTDSGRTTQRQERYDSGRTTQRQERYDGVPPHVASIILTLRDQINGCLQQDYWGNLWVDTCLLQEGL